MKTGRHIRHSNIVILMGYHITDELVLFIMNYIQSGSLHDIFHVKVMYVIIIIINIQTA